MTPNYITRQIQIANNPNATPAEIEDALWRIGSHIQDEGADFPDTLDAGGTLTPTQRQWIAAWIQDFENRKRVA
ncbi:MAG: hypothetical protein AB1589_43760 [Cyanobacteriota bacterium]